MFSRAEDLIKEGVSRLEAFHTLKQEFPHEHWLTIRWIVSKVYHRLNT